MPKSAKWWTNKHSAAILKMLCYHFLKVDMERKPSKARTFCKIDPLNPLKFNRDTYQRNWETLCITGFSCTNLDNSWIHESMKIVATKYLVVRDRNSVSVNGIGRKYLYRYWYLSRIILVGFWFKWKLQNLLSNLTKLCVKVF